MTDLSPASSEESRLFAFPSSRLALSSMVSALFLSFLFGVVYGGADYLTGMRTNHVRIDFSFEQNIPFIPELSPVYSSLYVLFLFVPFMLRNTQQLRSYVCAMTVMTFAAGVCFLLIPARLGFVSPPVDQVLPFSFRIADQLNLTYNLCPSLHAAYAVFHAQIFGCRAGCPGCFTSGRSRLLEQHGSHINIIWLICWLEHCWGSLEELFTILSAAVPRCIGNAALLSRVSGGRR